jgi:hypothetical protein
LGAKTPSLPTSPANGKPSLNQNSGTEIYLGLVRAASPQPIALSAMPGDVGVPLGDGGIDVDNSITETE